MFLGIEAIGENIKLYIELETGEIISPLIYAKNEWIEKHSVTPFFENIENKLS